MKSQLGKKTLHEWEGGRASDHTGREGEREQVVYEQSVETQENGMETEKKRTVGENSILRFT